MSLGAYVWELLPLVAYACLLCENCENWHRWRQEHKCTRQQEWGSFDNFRSGNFDRGLHSAGERKGLVDVGQERWLRQHGRVNWSASVKRIKVLHRFEATTAICLVEIYLRWELASPVLYTGWIWYFGSWIDYELTFVWEIHDNDYSQFCGVWVL